MVPDETEFSEADARRSRVRQNVRNWAGFAWRAAVGLLILSLVLIYGDISALGAALRRLHPSAFWLAFLLSLLGTIVVPAVITRKSMGIAGISLGFAELLRINLVMRFYVLVLPHAITVGLRWMRYRKGRTGIGWQLAALIAFERTVQLFVIAFSAAIFLLIRQSSIPDQLHLLVPISLIGTLALGLVVMMFVSRRLFALLRPIFDWIGGVLGGRGYCFVARVISAVADYQKLGQRGAITVFFWAVTGYFLFIASGYAVSVGFGLSLEFMDIGWIRSVVFVLTLLPITVGGMGVREAGFAVLFIMHGVDDALAVAYPLVLLAIQLLMGAIGGLLEVFSVFRSDGETRH